jgi:hypothetical protein
MCVMLGTTVIDALLINIHLAEVLGCSALRR